ncbi:hypothetical protein CPAL_05230 [Clostridium thermopalmarium DSM 5974]|uniref:Uncharacterized protein n=2 Tax=Clostridium TaxID=1485 RepID=A0A151ALC6_9CLOT|nr:hypothetical protein CLCOL_19140 [Clostridium colicanis DSM 13634]PRR75692.1 hypothetical protein CPAL_05230 [Clostridium thermopalmarium DSM 5974]
MFGSLVAALSLEVKKAREEYKYGENNRTLYNAAPANHN